jgi:hypothetical protein
MLKRLALLALSILFLFSACSSQEPVKGQVFEEQLGTAAKPSKALKEDSVSTAPGMIPADCEALLNKSQAWGYVPGQKWKAQSPEQMMEVARFFGDFRLVPTATSEAIRAWEAGGPALGPEAQLCDVFLSQTFLQALIDYSWGKAERLEAGKQLHRFLLNQQALTLPLAHRSLSAQVYVRAVKKGLLPGSHAAANGLGAWLEKEMVAATDEKKEQALSGKIRNRLGALLPLP